MRFFSLRLQNDNALLFRKAIILSFRAKRGIAFTHKRYFTCLPLTVNWTKSKKYPSTASGPPEGKLAKPREATLGCPCKQMRLLGCPYKYGRLLWLCDKGHESQHKFILYISFEYCIIKDRENFLKEIF